MKIETDDQHRKTFSDNLTYFQVKGEHVIFCIPEIHIVQWYSRLVCITSERNFDLQNEVLYWFQRSNYCVSVLQGHEKGSEPHWANSHGTGHLLIVADILWQVRYLKFILDCS